MINKFTIAAIISAIILSSIVYTAVQQTRNETQTLPVQRDIYRSMLTWQNILRNLYVET